MEWTSSHHGNEDGSVGNGHNSSAARPDSQENPSEEPAPGRAATLQFAYPQDGLDGESAAVAYRHIHQPGMIANIGTLPRMGIPLTVARAPVSTMATTAARQEILTQRMSATSLTREAIAAGSNGLMFASQDAEAKRRRLNNRYARVFPPSAHILHRQSDGTLYSSPIALNVQHPALVQVGTNVAYSGGPAPATYIRTTAGTSLMPLQYQQYITMPAMATAVAVPDSAPLSTASPNREQIVVRGATAAAPVTITIDDTEDSSAPSSPDANNDNDTVNNTNTNTNTANNSTRIMNNNDGGDSKPQARAKPVHIDISNDSEEESVRENADTSSKDVAESSPKKRKQESMRPDVVAAILGWQKGQATNGAQLSSSTTARKSPPQAEAQAQTSSKPGAPKGAKAKETKKRKPMAKSKRSLHGRKEKDTVEKLLKAKIDLSIVLPVEDCNFLGSAMWIFTLNQLRWILEMESNDSANEEERRQALRKELFDKLKRSKLFPKPAPVSQGATQQANTNHSAKPAPMEIVNGEDAITQRGCAQMSSSQNSATPATNQRVAAVGDNQEQTQNNGQTTTTTAVTAATTATPTTGTAKASVPAAATESSSTREGHATDEMVQSKVEEWKNRINSYETAQASGVKAIPVEQQFVLDGPISTLLSKCLQNFLNSVNVTTLWQFMELRKTESGRAVDMFRIWRRNCDLPGYTVAVLAKYLVSIGLRVEHAFGTKEVLDQFTRSWTSGALVALTGAATAFTINHLKITCARSFADMQTKSLADRLVLWREQKGMVPLKGTGKVAMISSWKAVVKEVMDCEHFTGSVIINIDFLKESEREEELQFKMQALEAAGEKAKPKPKAKQDDTTPRTRAVHSRKVIHLAKVCEEAYRSELKKIGIATPEQLLAAKETSATELVNLVSTVRQQTEGAPVDETEATKIVASWCRKAEKVIELIQKFPTSSAVPQKAQSAQSAAAAAKTPAPAPTSPKPKANVQAAKTEPKTQPKPAPVKSVSVKPVSVKPVPVKPVPVKPVPVKPISSASPPPAAPAKAAVPPPTPKRGQKQGGPPKQPYDHLSNISKSFLATLGITTAEEFLSSRTTRVAKAFVSWRVTKQMSVLKGMGAIASVSGWKAQVRKALRKAGLDHIADISPQQAKATQQKKAQAKLSASDRREKIAKSSKPDAQETTDKRVLFGAPQRNVVVAGESRKYAFELSVRSSSTAAERTSIYLTYDGCTASLAEPDEWKTLESSLGHGGDVPILRDCPGDDSFVPHGNFPFASFLPGAGAIELGRHGVFQIPQTDGITDVIEVVKKFIGGDSVGSKPEPAKQSSSIVDKACHSDKSTSRVSKQRFDRPGPWNVIERFSAHGERYCFFCTTQPMEKGQTVELRFYPSDPSELISGDIDIDTKRRLWIQQRLTQMTMKNLRDLLDCIQDSIGPSIYSEWNKIFNGTTEANATMAGNFALVHSTVVARRRMHWVTMRINTLVAEMLQSKTSSIGPVLPPVANAPLWKAELVSALVAHPLWKQPGSQLQHVLHDEATHEIQAAMRTPQFGAFFSSQHVWCNMAKQLVATSTKTLSRYLIELDRYGDGEKLGSELSSMVALSTQSIVEASRASCAEPKTVDEFTLDYSNDAHHFSFLIPRRQQVLQSISEDSYREAMILCGEPGFDMSHSGDQRLLATTKRSSGKDSSSSPSMYPTTAVGASKQVMNTTWYIERQVLAVLASVAHCSLFHISQTVKPKMLESISKAMLEAAQSVSQNSNIKVLDVTPRIDDKLERLTVPEMVVAEATGGHEKQRYEPSSSQLFLGLVWPEIKQLGWRVDADETMDSISFAPPDRNRVGSSRARLVKREAAKKRQRISQKAEELGLGYVPKRSKRLFINSTTKPEEDDTAPTTPRSAKSSKSVDEALQRFHSALQTNTADGDSDSLQQIYLIVEQITACFDKLAPNLFFGDEEKPPDVPEDSKPSKVYGCQYLMRFLLTLPNILQQMTVSQEQLTDLTGVTRELVDFLATNHADLFDESFHVPPEQYLREALVPAFTIPRLNKFKKQKRNHGTLDDISMDTNDDLREIVLATDRGSISEFVASIMDQVMVCRATKEDSAKKYRRINVGFPGLLCKHCLGANGDGKLFYSSIESFSTATTSLEKHFGRCNKIDPDILREIADCKTRHRDQLKNAGPGAQGAYFLRLWKRMQRSNAPLSQQRAGFVNVSSESAVSDKHAAAQDDPGTSGGNPASNSNEFRCHLKLLEYLKTTSPWKDRREITDAIDQYYSGLACGGRLVHTGTMPLHFSSEWLLSKIAPSRGRRGK